MLDLGDDWSHRRYSSVVARARSRHGKIAKHQRAAWFRPRDQLRQHQEIGTRHAVVLPVNRQDVRADLQEVPDGRRIEFRHCNRRSVGTVVRGPRIPERRSGRVVRSHHVGAVEVGNEAVIELQSEGQRVDFRHVRHHERDADVNRLVHVEHRGHVQAEQRVVIRSRRVVVIAHARRTAGPCFVGIIAVGPAESVVIRGDIRARDVPRGQQNQIMRISGKSIRDVRDLPGVNRTKFARDIRAVRLDETQVFARFGEPKVCVQRRTCVAAIAIRREDEQVAVSVEDRRGKRPLLQFVRRVSEVPSAQIDGVGAAVVDFDPVRFVAEVVRNRRGVLGHELGDDDLAGCLDTNRQHGRCDQRDQK